MAGHIRPSLRKPTARPQGSTTFRQLKPRVEHPPKIFVLPNATLDPGARFVSLVSPATGSLERYIYCPTSGFYELSIISRTTSLLGTCLVVGQLGDGSNTTPGYVLEEARVYVATPLDAIFLVTPIIFAGPGTDAKTSHPRLRTEEDLLDDIAHSSKHMQELARLPKARHLLLESLRTVSNVTEGYTDGPLLDPGPEKFLQKLLDKAAAMSTPDVWPASMEAKILRQLEKPSSIAQDITAQSQLSAKPSVCIQSVSEDQTTLERVTAKFRIRAAMQFLIARYVKAELGVALEKLLDTNNMVDFSELDAHLVYLQKLRVEALALHTLSDNISRKRGTDLDDEEANGARETKRRRKEEEDSKRKAESRASKELRKVDTSGMQKLSSFFTRQSSK